MRLIQRIGWGLLFGSVLAAPAHGQGGCQVAGPSVQRVSLARSVPSDRTKDDVRRVLVDEARGRAVEQAGGVTVANLTYRQRQESGVGAAAELTDLYLEQFRQEVGGRIVQECVRFVDMPGDTVRVDFSALVEVETERPSPGFVGEVHVDHDGYREGDEVKVTVESRETAQVFLFAVTRDGTATQFFPHRFDSANVVQAGEPLTLPRKGSPYQLVVTPDPKYAFPQAEYVLAVFYKGTKTAPFKPSDAFTKAFSFTELNRELLRMPRGTRTESAAAYLITGPRRP